MRREVDIARWNDPETCFKGAKTEVIKNDRQKRTEL